MPCLPDDVATEFDSLTAIYGPAAVKYDQDAQATASISFGVEVALLEPHEDQLLKLNIRLPSAYPHDAECPSVDLSQAHIGKFKLDDEIKKQVTKLGADFCSVGQSGCVYEIVEEARSACTLWYASQCISNDDVSQTVEVEKDSSLNETQHVPVNSETHNASSLFQTDTEHLIARFKSSEPIVDRKSVFVGHACEIRDAREVQTLVDALKTDRRISRATHNIVAWRCGAASDNYDDGEDAAGSRLAHLLQLLHVDNVLIVVSRWYGGIHLCVLYIGSAITTVIHVIVRGADRFKHINAAARAALGEANLLPDRRDVIARGKKR